MLGGHGSGVSGQVSALRGPKKLALMGAIVALVSVFLVGSVQAAASTCGTSTGGSVTVTYPAYTTSTYYPGYDTTTATWHPGYTTTVSTWHPGYTTTVKTWHDGYYYNVSTWHAGYYYTVQVWQPGYYYYVQVWHDGWWYKSYWHDGYWDCTDWQFIYTGDYWRCDHSVWHPGWWVVAWHPGYWYNVQKWQPGYYYPVQKWHAGYWYNVSTWHPGWYTTSTVSHPGWYTYSQVYTPGWYTYTTTWTPGYTVVTQHPARTVTTPAPPESACVAVGPYVPDPSAPVAITGMAEHFWITGDTGGVASVDWTFGDASFPLQGTSVWYAFPTTGMIPYSAQITWADGATATVGGMISVKQVQSVAG